MIRLELLPRSSAFEFSSGSVIMCSLIFTLGWPSVDAPAVIVLELGFPPVSIDICFEMVYVDGKGMCLLYFRRVFLLSIAAIWKDAYSMVFSSVTP